MAALPRAELLWKPSAKAGRFSLVEFRGEEAACADFEFSLTLRGERGATPADRDAAVAALLGRPVAFGFEASGGPRWFHGYVGEAAAEGPREVSLTVVPWLWFLAQDRGHRTYLNLSVPRVIEAVLREHPFADFRWEVADGDYPAVERVVRFDESTAAFVTRLLSHAGIAWHWEHDAAGGGHTLVMADGSVPPKASPGNPIPMLSGRGRGAVRMKFGIRTWQPGRTVTATAIRVADYDPAGPRTPALAAAAGDAAGPATLERFESPAALRGSAEAQRLARARRERAGVEAATVTGSGDATRLEVGRTFRTDAAAGEFLTTSVQHRLSESRSGLHYENEFACIPAANPYRPPAVEPPRIPGAFPGHVVGPDGTINPSASAPVHTDDRGRIRIRFAWHGPNEDSGWVRVAHPGGQMRIPRIGEEVYVVWEHGLPDRPVVIASSLPTADDALFEPKADPLPVVIRQPFPGGDKMNELRFDSAKGKEELRLHAGKDATIEAAGTLTESVGKNRRAVTRGNDSRLVEGGVVEVCKKARVVRSNGATAVSAGKVLVLKSKTKIVIDAPKIVLRGPGSFIEVSGRGVTIEGHPFTRINCGGSAAGEAEPAAEPEKLPPPPKQLPKPKQPLLLAKPKEPLLLPKPRNS